MSQPTLDELKFRDHGWLGVGPRPAGCAADQIREAFRVLVQALRAESGSGTHPTGARRDMSKLSAIEVSFAIPVTLTRDQERRLTDLVQEIAKANEPAGHLHWLSGTGHKPNLSQADARFLGRTPDANAPESGEPTWDDTIFHMETYCRERFDNE